MNKKLLITIAFAVSMLCACMAFTGCGSKDSTASAEAPTVEAPTGTYIGVANDGITEFKGIRYGTLNPYQRAGDVTTTTKDVIEAKDWGYNCLQQKDELESASQDPCSQDCLFLNIWTKDPDTKDKPVIFWIHGGGYAYGGTSDPLYDGQYFVRNLPEGEDCVLVSINYRLTFMGSADLSVLDGYTDDYKESRCLNKLDQMQALKWVSENIEAWGGDKDNVTIMGQSSGSAAVHLLVADNEANKYFRRAIAASGIPQGVMITEEECKANSKQIFDILDVKSVDELVSLSDEDIMAKMDEIYENVYVNGIVADGITISKTWYDDLMEGAGKDIDLMSGHTDGEYDGAAIDWDNVPNAVKDYTGFYKRAVSRNEENRGVYAMLYSDDIESVLDRYLALDDDKVKGMMNYLTSNYIAQLICSKHSEYNEHTYEYEWQYAPKNTDVIAYSGEAAEYSPWSRALHCMDIPFAFGTLENGYTELTGDPKGHPENLVRDWQASIYSFAKTGDPNNEYVDTWVPFGKDEHNEQIIGSDGTFRNEPEFKADAFAIMQEVKMNGVKNQ